MLLGVVGAWADALERGIDAATLSEGYRSYVSALEEDGCEDRFIAALSTWIAPERPMEGLTLDSAIRARAMRAAEEEAGHMAAEEAERRRQAEEAERRRQAEEAEKNKAEEPPLTPEALKELASIYDEKIGRVALHAYKIEYKDPFDLEDKVFEAEIPQDMQRVISSC